MRRLAFLLLQISISTSMLGLTACGGGGIGATAPGSDTQSPDPATPADPDPVDPDPVDPDPVDPDPVDPAPVNRAPVAENVSLSNDLSAPYLTVTLLATDPDRDTLNYVLDSEEDGPGYKDAFIEPDTAVLHATLKDSATGTVTLHYKATDGLVFSNRASVSIRITDAQDGGLGANELPPEDYGRIEQVFFDGDLQGGGGNEPPTLPESIDLSGNFPLPGNQGRQSSCVGWATAYALKSYQEKVEEQWEFSTGTIFSPAWVYNQVNFGVDGGAYITDGLQLLVDKGAASWASMPYDEDDYVVQPSEDALTEAAQFKAVEFGTISSVQQMKAALANRSPIVAGIVVYSSLNNLNGRDAVYNDLSGDERGRHAVVIVGYDDKRFGGAFKVINSWGTGWGDGGFFWLPYDRVSDLVRESLVLTDGVNADGVTPPVPTPPPQRDLPNLKVVDWDVSYDPKAGGAGSWNWEVVNAGTRRAPAGADVNLMLSVDQKMDPSDWYVVYEEIADPLAPGESARRDSANPMTFTLPERLTSGSYYMAVWVDDLQEIEESDETDNSSFAEAPVEISESPLPDLAIEYWWANWDATGAGTLEYTVTNLGSGTTRRADWDINLVLSLTETPREERTYLLFYEQADTLLASGQSITRDENRQGRFSLMQTQDGEPVEPGTYYLSLWIDDEALEQEDNEVNNLSIGNQQPRIDESGVTPAASSEASAGRSATRAPSSLRFSSFNGKRLPSKPQWVRRVNVVEGRDGIRRVIMADDAEVQRTPSIQSVPRKVYSKRIGASDPVVFPRTQTVLMPEPRDMPYAK
ncbi:MAG: hypothetical protein IPM37_05785 [Hahellaceae bacterium]|nr:hypothetical protein [Hahellaceae bacterium]